MTLLRSAVFNLFFAVLTLFMAITGLPVLLLGRQVASYYVRGWANTTLFLLRAICGTSYEVRGREHMQSPPVIYACKHQSAWDVFILVILLTPFPVFVLKRELLRIPLIGWYMRRWGVIAINRSRRTEALKAMTGSAKGALHSRRPLIIYPEGTRRHPGDAPFYQAGVALLYQQMKVPVVPVALNSGCFWGKNAFIKKPGTIVIEFLPAIPPGLPMREMMTQLEDRTEAAVANLLAEAR